MKAKLVLLTTGLLLAAVPLFAHHSFAGSYFEDQNSQIQGTVVEFSYRSPHSFVVVDATDPKTGEMARWSVEWRSATRLGREGVHQDTLKPGDRVIIAGHPGRNANEHRLHMAGIRRPSDGWKYGNAAD